MKAKGLARLTLLLFLLISVQIVQAQTSTFPPVGNAIDQGNGCYQLTQNTPYIMGGIWFDPQIDLSEAFDIRVNLNFGSNFFWDGSDVTNIYPEATGGADGIAFVLQQADSAAGDVGEAMGYGLIDPSLTIEFDSYYNFNADPLYDHVAISYSGNHIHTTAPYGNYSEGVIQSGATVAPLLGTDPVADNVQTGQDYPVRFTWDPTSSTFEVWFNCQLKISYTDNMFIDTIFNNNPNVFYGFTSATGSEFNEHTVCMIYNSNMFDIPDETICVGDQVQLDGTLSNAPAGTVYSWTPSLGLSNSNIPNPIASPNTTTEYVLTITDPCYPDPIYDTVLITVNAGNSVAVNPAGPFCEADAPVVLTSNGGSATWTGNGITNTSTGEFSPSIAGVGTHTIYFDEIGYCGGADTIQILVNPTPVVTIMPAGPYCVQESPQNLSANIPGGEWTGNGITNITTGVFEPQVAGTGNHQISYAVGGACPTADTIIIDVTPLNQIIIDPAGPFCITDIGQNLNVSVMNGIWTGNGVDPQTGYFDPTLAGVGQHTIFFHESSACGGVDSVIIEVEQVVQVDIGAVGPFCIDDPTLNLNSNATNGSWIGNGVDPISGSFNPFLAGVGTHQVIYSIGGLCPSSDTIYIDVDQAPIPQFLVDSVSGCAPLTVSFTDLTLPAGVNCFWDFGDGNTSNQCGNVTHTFTSVGCYDVSYTATSALGCSASVTYADVVCVSEPPLAQFIYSPDEILLPNSTVDFHNLSENADQYIWEFGNLGGSNDEHPSFTFPEEIGLYDVCLTAINDLGCEDEICTKIRIVEDFIIYVPNAFTPDGDQYNQTFYPVISGIDITSYSMYIFNRWGEVLFESHNKEVGWDGRYLGNFVQDGVYVWKIDFKLSRNDEKKEYFGHVSVLR